MPKEGDGLSKNTIIMDLSMIRKIKREFTDKKLKELNASYIQERLNSMEHRRTAEGVYTLLKLALDKVKTRPSCKSCCPYYIHTRIGEHFHYLPFLP